MTLLHQLIALHKTAKPAGESALTKAHMATQRAQPLAGFRKTYQPATEEGQKLPSEGTRLQARVSEILAASLPAVKRMIDLTVTMERTNQTASADVVDPDTGEVIIANVPVGGLLFLEKFAANCVQMVEKIPVTDPSENWTWDQDNRWYKTDEQHRTRTDKVPEVVTKAQATDKHPAQTEILYLDKVVGTWTTVQYSGAVTETTKRELAEKARKFQAAVKTAREQANTAQVVDVKVGEDIMKYLGWGDIEPKA